MKSALRLSLVLALVPVFVAAIDPAKPVAKPAMGKEDAAIAKVDVANAQVADAQGKMAQWQSLLNDLKAGELTAAADADEATKAAVAERKSRLVSAMQSFSPEGAKPSEATTGQFVTDLQAALKPTLDSLPTDASSATKADATSLMNKVNAAAADPKASMMNMQSVQDIMGTVQSVLKNPSMAPADLTAHMDKLTKLLTDLKVAPEGASKLVSSLQAMVKESAALLPK